MRSLSLLVMSSITAQNQRLQVLALNAPKVFPSLVPATVGSRGWQWVAAKRPICRHCSDQIFRSTSYTKLNFSDKIIRLIYEIAFTYWILWYIQLNIFFRLTHFASTSCSSAQLFVSQSTAKPHLILITTTSPAPAVVSFSQASWCSFFAKRTR